MDYSHKSSDEDFMSDDDYVTDDATHEQKNHLISISDSEFLILLL